MKDQAIVCNIGHFDNEIQVEALDNLEDVIKIKYQRSSRQVYICQGGNSIYLLASGRLVNLRLCNWASKFCDVQ